MAKHSSYKKGGWGELGNGRFPSPNWRPYLNSSPFNTPIPEDAVTKINSANIIERLVLTNPSYFVAGDPAKDWGVAIYYSDDIDDSPYRIHCEEPWGTSEIEGDVIYLPYGAKPSGVWPLPFPSADYDSHLTVVDQRDNTEYDLWNIRSISTGHITCKWGGKTDIEGDGLGSGAVAAEYGALGGLIRAEEFKRGKIDHALSLTVPCTDGYVWPATKGGLECSESGMPTQNALQQGDLLQLDISDDELDTYPVWKRGILKAWRKYGAYVGDTTGSQDWALKFESAASYTSLGFPDPYIEVANILGMDAYDYNSNGEPEYWFDLPSRVDWTRLRVIDQRGRK